MIDSALIHEAPGLADARAPDEQERVLDLHRELQREAKERGSFIAATQLAEVGATTIRHVKNDTLVTDGPFAETRELFVGFYLFEAESLDEAIALAGRIPISELGHVEVRPVVFSESVALTSR
jgi:hypothetical protein